MREDKGIGSGRTEKGGSHAPSEREGRNHHRRRFRTCAQTARRFVEEGARVVITDINPDKGEAVAAELGDNAVFVPGDHTRRSDNERAVATALDRFGALDILHNNAGAPFSGSFEGVDDATLDRIIGINLIGPFLMTQAAMPALVDAGKRQPGGAAVIFTASLQAVIARPNFTPYTAAKHGIIGLVKGLALEYADRNVRVNAICPAATATPMLSAFLPGMADDMDAAMERFRQSIPLGRMPDESDTANTAVFLASDEARMITGIALPVDGGTTAG